MITFTFTGGPAIEKALIEAGQKIARNTTRRGLSKVADIAVEEIRARAPRLSGGLVRSIKKGNARPFDGGVSIRVGTYGRDKGGDYNYFLGLFYEYGVAPHTISAGNDTLLASVRATRASNAAAIAAGGRDFGNDGMLGDIERRAASRVLKIGERFVTGPVLHPGIRPRPFMRPGLDAAAERIVNDFTAYLASELTSGGYLMEAAEAVDA